MDQRALRPNDELMGALLMSVEGEAEIAYGVPIDRSTDPKTVEEEKMKMESDLIKNGTLIGMLSKNEETAQIRKANLIARAKQHNEIEALKVGKQVAIIRAKEDDGSEFIPPQITHDAPKSGLKAKQNGSESKSSNLFAKGYETKPYECTEYKGMEYNSKYEYKSVYD